MTGAITAGNLIITGDLDLLDHEYGHYLDYKYHFNYNKAAYLKNIGIQSAWSAYRNDYYGHQLTVSEKRANILGAAWSGRIWEWNDRFENFGYKFRLSY
jgi:hypothetical protein